MQFHTIYRFFPVLFINLSFIIPSFSYGYEIKIQIKGMENKEVILAHYLNKSIYPDDTITFNSKGIGIYEGKNNLHQGMYIIYLPSGKYFEFLLGEDQVFSIRTDTSNFVLTTEIEGSDDNRIFFDFQKYMLEKRPDLLSQQQAIKNAANEEEKEKAIEELKGLTTERNAKVKAIINEYPDLFVSTFLKATLEIEVPDPPVNEDGSIDSTWQYRYYKKHYFDNFNPHDGRLLYTPLYEDKIMSYLEKVVLQIPDTLIREVDFLIDGSKEDSTLFRYLLVSLFNYYGNSNIMGMDAVQVHLAEKYYLHDAWWTDEDFLDELRERVEILKPLILGNEAPNVELLFVPSEHFKSAANDTALKKYPHVGHLAKIQDLESDYIVLLFWEATCSHCKKAVPKMYEIYKEKLEPEGIKVVAISTLFGEEGKIKWIDFVNKYQLYDWMNAWNPYDYQYKVKYDIRSTPQIFVLDKNKKIIGKRIAAEQVYELIQAYKKQNEK